MAARTTFTRPIAGITTTSTSLPPACAVSVGAEQRLRPRRRLRRRSRRRPVPTRITARRANIMAARTIPRTRPLACPRTPTTTSTSLPPTCAVPVGAEQRFRPRRRRARRRRCPRLRLPRLRLCLHRFTSSSRPTASARAGPSRRLGTPHRLARTCALRATSVARRRSCSTREALVRATRRPHCRPPALPTPAALLCTGHAPRPSASPCPHPRLAAAWGRLAALPVRVRLQCGQLHLRYIWGLPQQLGEHWLQLVRGRLLAD